MLYAPMAVLHYGEQPPLYDPSLSISLADQADDFVGDIINFCPLTSPVICTIIASLVVFLLQRYGSFRSC